MSTRLFAFCAIAMGLVTLSGCASTESDKKTYVNPDKEKVSTIPWNKPASWEGQGQMGGLGNAMGNH